MLRCRCVLLVGILVLFFTVGHAERTEERLELGLRFAVADVAAYQVTEPGVGIFAGVHLASWKGFHFSIDTQADYFPGIHSFSPDQKRFSYWRAPEEVSKQQAMAGIRVGRIWREAEIYGRFRAGAFRFSDFTILRLCTQAWPYPEACYGSVARTRALVDVGAGVIIDATGPWFLRIDLGDSLVSYDPRLLNPASIGTLDDVYINTRPGYSQPWHPSRGESEWKHHFQTGLGIGFRF